MGMTDPIADMLTRIRNANRIDRDSVDMPISRTKEAVAKVLKDEGFIRDFKTLEVKPQSVLRVYLKRGPNGERLISVIRRASKPGKRVYRGVDDLAPVLGGLGISVVSTSKGLMSDRECRNQKIGGEVLCTVW